MAVYTHISKEELDLFLEDYQIGKLIEYHGISEGVENTNYKIITETGPYILTLYENRVERQDIPFFLEYMFHLSSNKIKCPLPVKNKDDKLFSELNKKPASILTFLEGTSTKDVTKDQAFELGSVLAKIHLMSANLSIKRKNPLDIDSIKNLISGCGKNAKDFSIDLEKEIINEYERIKESWPDDIPKGIIHADLFPDNILFNEKKISGVIDFSFSCNDFLSYDLSICINAWCFKNNRFDIILSENLISGYQSIRKLEKEEIKNLPVLCSGSALRFLLTRLNDWKNDQKDVVVTPKNPKDFIDILNFHKNIKKPEEYGV
ncbi:MAG: homoserine kinase [Pseudomonadota bacterium]|nr:homoserine kinase [Pseudomonadota bacterium]